MNKQRTQLVRNIGWRVRCLPAEPVLFSLHHYIENNSGGNTDPSAFESEGGARAEGSLCGSRSNSLYTPWSSLCICFVPTHLRHTEVGGSTAVLSGREPLGISPHQHLAMWSTGPASSLSHLRWPYRIIHGGATRTMIDTTFFMTANSLYRNNDHRLQGVCFLVWVQVGSRLVAGHSICYVGK